LDVVYDMPSWHITVIVLITVLVAIEVGHRLARRNIRRAARLRGDEVTQDVKTAVMALLGLLLAFSFSFSSERYDARMRVNWKEANAIGTSFLRASLLDEPDATQMKELFRAYLEVRIAYGRIPSGNEAIPRLDAETRRLQAELWKTAMEAASRDRHNVMAALTVQSVNATIDIATEQQAVRRNHVPLAVFMLLYLATLVASVLLGYSTKSKGVRNVPVWCAFAGVVALVMFTIVDLDRPRRGVIRVDTDALVELRQLMGLAPATGP
jgi:uncharacterized membrane protein YjfL (UPF0719 family)